MTELPPSTVKQGRYAGRMQRSAFWARIIPMNILYNLGDRIVGAYYSERIEAVDKQYAVEQDGELIVPEEMLGEAFSAIYAEILPLAAFSALILLAYVIITSPWYVRRLHDIGMSGKWFLVWLAPAVLQIVTILTAPILPEFVPYIATGLVLLAGLFMLICALIDSRYEANRYGESPKYGPYKRKLALPQVPTAEK